MTVRRILSAGCATLFAAAAVVLVPATAQAASLPGATPATYYENCTAVRDAGKAPLSRGDDGYSSHLDRDGDGIACEVS